MTECFTPINNLTMQYTYVELLSCSAAQIICVYVCIYIYIYIYIPSSKTIHRANAPKMRISSPLLPFLLMEGFAKGKSSYKRKLARRLHISTKLWVSCKQKLLNR